MRGEKEKVQLKPTNEVCYIDCVSNGWYRLVRNPVNNPDPKDNLGWSREERLKRG